MSNHTPTPWTIHEYDDGFGVSRVIEDDLEPICICEDTIDHNHKANAAYIVKAVNAHEDLVEALKFCREQLEEYNNLGADIAKEALTKSGAS